MTYEPSKNYTEDTTFNRSGLPMEKTDKSIEVASGTLSVKAHPVELTICAKNDDGSYLELGTITVPLGDIGKIGIVK